jgi:hypothetical protein
LDHFHEGESNDLLVHNWVSNPGREGRQSVNDPIPAGAQSPTGATSGEMRCPTCGATDNFTPAVELRASFNWLVFLAGGLLAIVFRNAGRPRKMRCNQCAAIFETRTSLSTLSLVIFWLLIGPTIIALIWLLVAMIFALFSN